VNSPVFLYHQNPFFMFYVYILYSSAFDKYYVGHTDDIERRLKEHSETSEKSYTSKYRPWEIAACFAIGDDRRLAMKVERHLKNQNSKNYLRETIKRDNIDLIINNTAQLVRAVPMYIGINP
jgi:putative endonuclease